MPMELPLPDTDATPPALLPWQQAAELQDDLLTVCNDLDRLQTLLASACADLSQGFQGASALLTQGRAEEPGAHWHEPLAQQLARAVTALQFEDMASQLITHTRRRLRHRADALAVAAFGDDDGEAVVEPAASRPNPVTQDEMDAGSIELF
jgi:hypothetical protein